MNIKPGIVYTLTYQCRDIGYGRESGTIEAVWTGEIDTWGKYTFRIVGSSIDVRIYLFADEITAATPLYAGEE